MGIYRICHPLHFAMAKYRDNNKDEPTAGEQHFPESVPSDTP